VTPGQPNWIELQGAVNARDVGGMPVGDGRLLRSGVLIRSASLQHLTASDVTYLVGTLAVRRIVDLRTDIEVGKDGPSPMRAEPDVVIHHLSLYPDVTDDAKGVAESPVVPNPVLPWQGDQFASEHGPVVASYLRYLERRPESIVAALRAIAEPDGATVVHCAAGKDRTGMVVALALTVVGVERETIAADYAATESQIGAIVTHLARSELYVREVSRPQTIPVAAPAIMVAVLDEVDAVFGGVLEWLAGHGWTDDDTDRLRSRLLG
jgi:protein-tyrosine phosphatase